MPYFISPERTVVVLPPGRSAPPGHREIDSGIASTYELRNGQVVTQDAVVALTEGRMGDFISLVTGQTADSNDASATQPPKDWSTHLPPLGRWEYKVRPISELGGVATAKGTANRMEDVLSELAAEGWELVSTTERDSRWIGGETVILILRRFVVSEALFRARFEAEERIRREIVASLDSESSG